MPLLLTKVYSYDTFTIEDVSDKVKVINTGIKIVYAKLTNKDISGQDND